MMLEVSKHLILENYVVKFIAIFLSIFAFFSACNQNTLNTAFPTSLNGKENNDEPLKITLCELQNDPMKFNHKLIEVTGFISQGFEDFSIFDPLCSSDQCVWLEYGGMAKSGTIYCCGETPAVSRPEPLVIENIPILSVSCVL